MSRQKEQQGQRPQESSRKRKEQGGPGQECVEEREARASVEMGNY